MSVLCIKIINQTDIQKGIKIEYMWQVFCFSIKICQCLYKGYGIPQYYYCNFYKERSCMYMFLKLYW